MPAKELFGTLPRAGRGSQGKMLELFKWFADEGKIVNNTKFKSLGKEGGGLFEFKDFQTRFIGNHRPGNLFVIAHGVNDKKSDDLRPADVQKAIRILKEHDSRTEKRGVQ